MVGLLRVLSAAHRLHFGIIRQLAGYLISGLRDDIDRLGRYEPIGFLSVLCSRCGFPLSGINVDPGGDLQQLRTADRQHSFQLTGNSFDPAWLSFHRQ